MLPTEATSTRDPAPLVPAHAPEFVKQVTAMMIAGRGDELPVSALPVDGTYPPGTARWEKRNVSDMVPVWEPELCIQCGNCAMVCPHATIRARYYDDPWLANAPEGFASAPLAGRGFPNLRYTLQVAVEDCTGCELCVEACPVRSLEAAGTRAINMGAKAPILERERKNLAFFDTLPDNKPAGLDGELVRGAQYLTPLFEFSGACAGCGETPYLRLLTQLFGDRLLVANATGCSSIYGGNLPTTPWSVNREGRGPAWSNSLFEDNAEFGLGFRLSLDKHREEAEHLLARLAPQLGQALVREVLDARQVTQEEVDAQRNRVAALEQTLDALNDSTSKRLRTITKHLVRKSVWIVGGDGWAYDIGYGGLDHVLASGRNVNILVLDTEVYSNTGGQASKATPRGGVAKFAAGGKQGRKKDLGLMAVAYGNVYVAQIAMGASSQQTMDAFLEAEAHDGPSLIIAYSHCIAHGINMRYGMRQQKLAVECGHWPLYRFKPATAGRDRQEFVLDSQAPSIPLKTYAYNEIRYKMLSYTKPDEAQPPARPRAGRHPSAVARVLQPGRPVAGNRAARPGRIWQSRSRAGSRVREGNPEAVSSRRRTMDMTTHYMGLTLKNPLVASASPLSESLDGIRRLEDNGAAAVVMFSLFEEQIRHDSAALEHFLTLGSESFGEAVSYFPEIQDYDVGPRQYLDLIRRATESVDIPIIASLNGVSEHGWVTFAREMQDAGATASS